jgi:hypothetical protein
MQGEDKQQDFPKWRHETGIRPINPHRDDNKDDDNDDDDGMSQAIQGSEV